MAESDIVASKLGETLGRTWGRHSASVDRITSIDCGDSACSDSGDDLTSRETAAVLALMASAWPNSAVDENRARVWTSALDDIHGEDGFAAAKLLIKNSKWFPTIAEFIETSAACRRRRSDARGLPAETFRGPRTESEKDTAARFIALCRGVVRDARNV